MSNTEALLDALLTTERNLQIERARSEKWEKMLRDIAFANVPACYKDGKGCCCSFCLALNTARKELNRHEGL